MRFLITPTGHARKKRIPVSTINDASQTLPSPGVPQPDHGERKVSEETEPRQFFVYLIKQLGGSSKNEANIKMSENPFQDISSHENIETLAAASANASSSTSQSQKKNKKTANSKKENASYVDDASHRSENSTSPLLTTRSSTSASTSSIAAVKASKGVWQIEMIIGPFLDAQVADSFRSTWLSTSRGLSSRRERGIQMVNEYNEAVTLRNDSSPKVTCYDKRLVPLYLNSYLEQKGLSELRIDNDVYMRLIESLQI